MSVDEVAVALHGWLSVPQLGCQLGVSTERARQLVRQGAVQAVHCPYGWLVEPTSAAKLVAVRAARAGQGTSTAAASV